MKRYFLILLAFAGAGLANAQNPDQARQFINKGQQAILKAQKEMLRLSDKSEETSLKKAIRYQAVAVQLYKKNKLKEAMDFEFKSRTQSIGLLEKLNKPASTYFLPSDEEKTFVSSDYSSLASDESSLSDDASDKIDQLNVLDQQKVLELELTVNQ
ncbi:MAG: hypothetical protein ACXVP0_00750 [Bacteroidia bacterium]